MIHLPFLLLRPMIPSQFENPLSISNGIDAVDTLVRRGGLGTIGKEVQSEVRAGVFAKQCHSHDFLVELEGYVFVFHPEHGVVHAVRIDMGFLDVFGLFYVVLGDDFDPVVIGVESEL